MANVTGTIASDTADSSFSVYEVTEMVVDTTSSETATAEFAFTVSVAPPTISFGNVLIDVTEGQVVDFSVVACSIINVSSTFMSGVVV